MLGTKTIIVTCRLAFGVAALTAGGISWAAETGVNEATVLKERRRLLTAVSEKGAGAVPTLTTALAADNELVYLTAAHLLAGLGKPAVPGLAKALEHPDHRVRLVAIKALVETDQLPEFWAEILLDKAPAVQLLVKLSLLGKHPMPKGEPMERVLDELTQRYRKADLADRKYVIGLFSKVDALPAPARRLLIEATTDGDAGVREVAYRAILEHIQRDWPQGKDLLAKADSDSSKLIQELGRQLRWKLMQVDNMGFSRQGWRFKTDPEEVGEKQGWYRADFDDSGWRTDVYIRTSWQNYFKGVYHGAAWYRRVFRSPTAGAWDKAYLHFEGVDEEAWVWLNGQFVGKHAEGPDGWNEPFLVDVTEALKSGEINQLTVRARNTAGGGGIHAPVWLRLLDSKALEKARD